MAEADKSKLALLIRQRLKEGASIEAVRSEMAAGGFAESGAPKLVERIAQRMAQQAMSRRRGVITAVAGAITTLLGGVLFWAHMYYWRVLGGELHVLCALTAIGGLIAFAGGVAQSRTGLKG